MVHDIIIKDKFGFNYYDSREQIYPWGYLKPGNYREVNGCCSGCQTSLECDGPILDGHMGCSPVAYNSKKEIIASELCGSTWISLVLD